MKRDSLTGTFFWVTTQTESFPRTPIEVIPAAFTALNAYSDDQSVFSYERYTKMEVKLDLWELGEY